MCRTFRLGYTRVVDGILGVEDEHVDSQRATHLLVVDDDPDICLLLANLLQTHGYTVRAAPDGQVALDLITRRPPWLMVMDLRMPVMDGWTLLRIVRARGLSLPVIVLTGEQNVENRLRSFFNVRYLAKPFLIEELLDLVKAFQQRRYQGENTIRTVIPGRRFGSFANRRMTTG
jgi:DNA-binding response OmpR family regulator